MQSVHTVTNDPVNAIDGRTLRDSYKREDRSSTIHMIRARGSSIYIESLIDRQLNLSFHQSRSKKATKRDLRLKIKCNKL